jgi:tetratricopeptide (TPR) repeat protein
MKTKKPLVVNLICYFVVGLLLLLFIGCELKTQKTTDIPVTSSSEEAIALFEKGRDALDFYRTDDARALFDEAISLDTDFALAYLYRAFTAISAGDWRTHVDKAKAAMEKASKGEQVLIKMTLTVLTNDREERMRLAEELVKLYPESPRAWIELGNQLDGMKKYEEAREKYNKAAEIDQSFVPDCRRMWGSYMFNDPKDFAKAEEYAKKQVELRGDEAQVYIDLGDVYRGQNNLEKARKSYTKATEVNPKSHVAFSKKGHANSFLGNLDEARSDYQMSTEVAVTGGSKIGWANFGTFTYLYADDFKGALAANQKVMDNMSEYSLKEEEVPGAMSNCCYNRYMMAMYGGDYESANSALKKYITHTDEWLEQLNSPDYSRQMKSYNEIYKGRLAAYEGRFDEAMSLAEASKEFIKDDKDPRKFEDYYRLIGTIHLLKKDYAKAAEAFDKANDQAIMVKFLKGQVMEGLDRNEEAKSLFNEVATFNFNGVEYALVRNKAIVKVK